MSFGAWYSDDPTPPYLRGHCFATSLRYSRLVVEEEWLSAEEAGRCLNLPASTIYLLIRRGQLDARLSPVRVCRADLDACLERCRIRAGQVAHLNQYAEGASRLGEPPITSKGRPDRRFGPRIESASHRARHGFPPA